MLILLLMDKLLVCDDQDLNAISRYAGNGI